MTNRNKKSHKIKIIYKVKEVNQLNFNNKINKWNIKVIKIKFQKKTFSNKKIDDIWYLNVLNSQYVNFNKLN